MISRRNIRVKVMQTIYTVNTLEQEIIPTASGTGEPQKILQQHLDQTRSLFIYLIYFLTELTRYAETDAHHRASKHLPSAEDLHVNTKIAGNELLLKMLEDPALKEQFAKEKPALICDKELLRSIYHTMADSPEYKAYTAQPLRDKAQEKKIIEFILNDLMLANETFVAHVEDNFSNWDDDGEMIVQL
ncbi:MAG TPA: transcription antitermination factor NusB, partial [Chitinophagaceae bacterium]